MNFLINTNIFLLFYLLVSKTYSQVVLNVQASQEGKQVVISYDLESGKSGEKFEIELYFSQENGTWHQIVNGLTGDIAKEVGIGNGKSIRWNPLQGFGKLTGDGYRFKIIANITNELDFGIGSNMVMVDGGSFIMGCTKEQGMDCDEDERPAHKVTLGSFYISKFEVTQLKWKSIMGTAKWNTEDSCDTCPVYNVSWYDSQAFIKKLNQLTGELYRLPTEAEWEFAARGGLFSKGYKYAGSNNLSEIGWTFDNYSYKVHQVGSKTPNELGLYDMSGFAWELCSDYYSEKYYKKSIAHNPKGPEFGEVKVIRGFWNAEYRVSDRGRIPLDTREHFVGFRLAKSY